MQKSGLAKIFGNKSGRIAQIIAIMFALPIIFSACSLNIPDINNWFSEPTHTVTVSPSPSATGTVSPSNTATITATDTSILESTETSTKTPAPSFTHTLDGSQTTTITQTITFTPTRTLIPTRTRFPTLTPRPSRTPTITQTPTPPLAYFRINNIGQFSFVTSPIRPEAIVSPGEDGLIVVELLGEDGRTITKETINYQSYIGRRFGIAPSIIFSLENVSEYGRLMISAKDRYNRTIALTSVDLLLLQLGSNKITAPKDLTEPYLIRQPVKDSIIQGGVIHVKGLARILSTAPIIIECINADGNIIAETKIEIEAPNQIMSHIPFEAYLPYSVEISTNVRFSVRQESASRLPGTIHLYSFEITLEP